MPVLPSGRLPASQPTRLSRRRTRSARIYPSGGGGSAFPPSAGRPGGRGAAPPPPRPAPGDGGGARGRGAAALGRFRADPEWKVVFDDDGVLVLRRG